MSVVIGILLSIVIDILKYYQRMFGLDDTRLVSLAMMDGLTFSNGTAGCSAAAVLGWTREQSGMSS